MLSSRECHFASMTPRKIKGQPTQPIPTDEPAPEAEAVTVVPEVVEELTEEELEERQRLELRVERSFIGAGLALRELRDRRLYRNTHKTFETYCQDRFAFGRAHSYRLIDAATVFGNLSPQEELNDLSPIRRQILPTRLEQVRPLAALNPNEQRQIWEEAVEQAGGKVHSGRVVKDVVKRLKEKHLPQLSITYKRGDAFTLQGLTGAERRYNGCWAIAREILELSLKVETYNAMLLVKPDNLNPIDDRAVRRQLTALLKRIKQLRKRELDRGAEVLLESLGKRTFLTEVEEGLLLWLENFYGVV